MLTITNEQNEALQTLLRCFRKGGIANLVGPYGSGKTLLARRLGETLEHEGVHVFGFSVIGHDFNSLIKRILDAVRVAGIHPLLVIMDEWEAMTWARVGRRATFQVLLNDIASRGPGSGLLLISANSGADQTNILPETLLARIITVRLRTSIRHLDPDNPTKNLTEHLPKNTLLAIVEQEIATRSDEDFLNALQNRAGNIYALILQSIERNVLARQITLLAYAQQLPDSVKVYTALESCGLAQRSGQGWAVASWLAEILGEAGLFRSNPDMLDYQQAVKIIDTSLLALAWEHYIRDLAASNIWLREEAEAAGLYLGAADGSLPRLLARIRQSPQAFVASLFRPSDVYKIVQDRGSCDDKEAILEHAFSQWCTEVHK